MISEVYNYAAMKASNGDRWVFNVLHLPGCWRALETH